MNEQLTLAIRPATYLLALLCCGCVPLMVGTSINNSYNRARVTAIYDTNSDLRLDHQEGSVLIADLYRFLEDTRSKYKLTAGNLNLQPNANVRVEDFMYDKEPLAMNGQFSTYDIEVLPKTPNLDVVYFGLSNYMSMLIFRDWLEKQGKNPPATPSK